MGGVGRHQKAGERTKILSTLNQLKNLSYHAYAIRVLRLLMVAVNNSMKQRLAANRPCA
jgi:hypothetical protein